MTLCPQPDRPAHCRCVGEGHALCPSFLPCTDAGACDACSDPDFAAMTHAGATGDPCEGFASAKTPVVHGHLECNYCAPSIGVGAIHAYKGENGSVCTGFSQMTGKRVTGRLVECR